MKFTDIDIISFHKKPVKEVKSDWVVIVGNPNSGKTAIFNRLTGMHGKVGNYPGVTVEKKTGMLRGSEILVRDLPGSYSLNPRSLDEQIVADTVQSWRFTEERPRAILVVVDSTNLARNLYLTLQVSEFGVPTILVLNMMDEAGKRGLFINMELLKELLGIHQVVSVSAKYGQGIPELIRSIEKVAEEDFSAVREPRMDTSDPGHIPLQKLTEILDSYRDRLGIPSLVESMRLVADDNYIKYLRPLLFPEEINEITREIESARNGFKAQGFSYQALESNARYKFIDLILEKVIRREQDLQKSFSEKIDNILTHHIWGPVSLVLILGFIFNAIFSWAEAPMQWITSAVAWTAGRADLILPAGPLKSLIVNGIISGVGNVIVFLPQIMLLVFFISLLEDSGYMARMAFIMDKLMGKIGLQGKSVLPMLSGFACAIPAVMAARTIENWQDRLKTILLIPLMSCSARLPVYVLLISAFIPHKTVLGFLQLQSVVLMGIYFLGFFTAVAGSAMVKKFASRKKRSQFIMEMPPYRLPLMRSVGWKIYNSTKLFLVNAGSIILAISVIMWFLASYPAPAKESSLTSRERVEQSYAGQMGHAMEPLIKPLGFDWKMGVGLISSFAAREVLVSSFATIYNIQDDDGSGNVPLIQAMREDRYADGRAVFTPLVAISLMVFFVYAAQCMSTFAIVRRETNSWRWPLVMVGYMNVLAFSASFIVFHGGKLFGLG
ncbi:MAG: ferrous iron transport protein B [Calditrichia bacterium]